MSTEIIDLTIDAFLPEDIKQQWIPLDGHSIPHLFQFTRYPPQNMAYQEYTSFSLLLHKEGVTNFEPSTLLQLGPPSSDLSDKYKAAIKATSTPVLSFTLVSMTGHPVRLPIWVLEYWREIDRPMGYQRKWKKVLGWLRGISQSEQMVDICDRVMVGLSYFPWNGGNCTVRDMNLLLTSSSLTDFHIESTLTKISHLRDHTGAEVCDHHILLSLFDLKSIVAAYKTSRTGLPGTKRAELLEVENKIISGQIESVAGVLFLPKHWTSIVITFKPPKILYGDSLGNPMPTDRAPSYKRWVSHMLSRAGTPMPGSDISIYPLSTGVQRDGISCGLFALNSISHHYLPQTFSILQHGTLSFALYRMELALELLQEGAVSHILYGTPLFSQLIVYHRLQSMTQVSHLPSSTSPTLYLFNHFQKHFQHFLPLRC